MRVMFFGSGAFGLPTLQHLHDRHEVVAVVSQPDRPAGRKQTLTTTPIAEFALAHSLTLWRSDDVNEAAFVAQVAERRPDASVVIAFGQKLGEPLIAAMGTLAVNLHGSLLPAYRGAAPIQRAIMDGCTTVGVSVIALAQRMDAGVVYATASLSVDPRATAGEVHDQLAELGPDAIENVLRQLAAHTLQPLPQDDTQATRAPKLSKAEGTVAFNQPAARARAVVHGLTPWPGCTVHWSRADQRGEPTTLFLRRVIDEPVATTDAPGTVVEPTRGLVATTEGAIRLLELQIPGGKPLPFDQFTRGKPFAAGDVLTPTSFA